MFIYEKNGKLNITEGNLPVENPEITIKPNNPSVIEVDGKELSSGGSSLVVNPVFSSLPEDRSETTFYGVYVNEDNTYYSTPMVDVIDYEELETFPDGPYEGEMKTGLIYSFKINSFTPDTEYWPIYQIPGATAAEYNVTNPELKAIKLYDNTYNLPAGTEVIPSTTSVEGAQTLGSLKIGGTDYNVGGAGGVEIVLLEATVEDESTENPNINVPLEINAFNALINKYKEGSVIIRLVYEKHSGHEALSGTTSDVSTIFDNRYTNSGYGGVTGYTPFAYYGATPVWATVRFTSPQ